MTKDDLVAMALSTTGMTRERWDFLQDAIRDDAHMNEIMKADWEKRPRDSDEAVRDYYRESDIWFVNSFNHGYGGLLRLTSKDPFRASSWQVPFIEASGFHVIDYGGGLLNDSWPFVMMGYQVDIAEVKGPVTDFLKLILSSLGLENRVKVIEVEDAAPLKDIYQGAISFETLEHVPDPVGLVREIQKHLSPGSPFAFSVSFGAPEHAPYHIAKNARFGDPPVWESEMKQVGFTKLWKDLENHHIQIWRRT